MKVLCVAPFYVCVELVVGGAALVFLVQKFFRVGIVDFVDFSNAFYSFFHIGVNEYAQDVRAVTQNVVGTATDDDARFFFGMFCDELCLEIPDCVFVRGGSVTASVDEHSAGFVGRAVFAFFFDVRFCKAAFLI